IMCMSLFLFNDTPTTEIYTLSLHDALPIWGGKWRERGKWGRERERENKKKRSEEHTSELQSHLNLVCRLLLETNIHVHTHTHTHTHTQPDTPAHTLSTTR